MAVNGELLLSLEDVTKKYGKFKALDGISLEIKKGEIFGFIGTNGAGKTTTIKIMAGLIQKFEGIYNLNGYNLPRDIVRVREMFGYMPQDAGFQEWRTVEHALNTFGKLSGMSGKFLDSRIGETLDVMGISEFRHKKIKLLSGGTIQKVGIAQAILHKPEILILDEPLNGLDPESRINLKQILKDLKYAGSTVFFSSHILSDVQDVADTIGIIDGGKILVTGAIDELKSQINKTDSIELILSEKPSNLSFLNDMNGITAIEYSENNHYIMRIADGVNIDELCDALVRRIVEKGCKIRSFGPARQTLDEIFLDYVYRNRQSGEDLNEKKEEGK